MTSWVECRVPECEADTAGNRKGLCRRHRERLEKTGSFLLARETRADRLAARQHQYEAACGGRSIPGWSGYFATSDGRIFTVLHKNSLKPSPAELHQLPDSHGYASVRLSGKRKTVHRLVALTFFGPCPAGMEVRHLDGTRTNSAVENLRYGTHAENSADCEKHGTRRRREQASHRWTDREVETAVRCYLAGGVTQREVAADYGTSQQVLSRWVKAVASGDRNRYPAKAA